MARCLTRVPAGELCRRVARVCDALAVLLISVVYAVVFTVAAPAHGDTQAIQAALKLVRVAASRGTCSCRVKRGDFTVLRWVTKEPLYKQLQERLIEYISRNTPHDVEIPQIRDYAHQQINTTAALADKCVSKCARALISYIWSCATGFSEQIADAAHPQESRVVAKSKNASQ